MMGSTVILLYQMSDPPKVIAAYTTITKARAARAHLNRERMGVVRKLAETKVGEEYVALSESGATMTLSKHDEKSALKYAGYEVPEYSLASVLVAQ